MNASRTIYKDGFIMEFHVKDKQKYYKISEWNESGTNFPLLKKGKLDGDPIEILDNFISTLVMNCEDKK